MRISSQLYRNGQVTIGYGTPIVVKKKKERGVHGRQEEKTLKTLKNEIFQGKWVDHTMTSLVEATGFTRHQLRHAGINTRTLAVGSTNLNLPDDVLKQIWGSQRELIAQARAARKVKPLWNENDPIGLVLKVALDVEQERAEKFKKILR